MRGLGKGVSDLKKRIKSIKAEISNMEKDYKELPELIETANLVRSNEALVKINDKKTELISYYETYSKHLEKIIDTMWDIQEELKDILRSQVTQTGQKRTKKR